MRPDDSELQGTDLAKQKIIDEFQMRLRKWVSMKPGPVSIVKFGAHDGTTDDWVGEVMIESIADWRGVMVEPQPRFLLKRVAEFPSCHFQHVTAGVGKSCSLQEFFYIDPAKKPHDSEDLPSFWDQIGSFSKDHVAKHLDSRNHACIQSISMPILTPRQVWPVNKTLTKFAPVDVLHIDVEGKDYEVFNACPLNADKLTDLPLFIVIEHEHMSGLQKSTFLNQMKDVGYVVKETFLDFIAYHPHLEIIENWETEKIAYESGNKS